MTSSRRGRSAGSSGRRAGAPGLRPVPAAVHRRSLRLAVARHRRLLAASSVAAAVAAAVQGMAPAPPPQQAVWVAARDLPAGHRLSGGDLRRIAVPPAAVPDGAAGRAAEGEVLAAPLRRGEPLTDVRLLGPGLLAGRPDGTVAVTVRVADPLATVAVRAGSRVDVLALPVSGAEGWRPEDGSTLVAADALVLALPGAAGGDDGSGGFGSGPGLGGGLLDGRPGGSAPVDPAGSGAGAGVLLLAVDRATASELAAAQAARSLTVVVG